MTRIYLIRHAEAEGNAARRIHGQYDSRITENGMKQIEALKARFADVPIDACYSSDLNRTCVTARSIYIPKNLELRRDVRFREIGLGRWEDLPFGWLDEYEPDSMSQFSHDPVNWSVEGSETFDVYTARFLEAMKEAAEAHDGKTIAIFSHGCVLRGVQYLLSGNQWPRYFDNTAVSCLEYENGKYQINFLNDSSHLSDDISTFIRQKWWRQGGDRRDFNMWYRAEGAAFYAYLRQEQVGKVEVELPFGAALSIANICLDEEHRGRHLGEQLLGCAASFARTQNRHALRLVIDEDARALSFFLRHGFVEVGREGSLLKLEKDIRVPQ